MWGHEVASLPLIDIKVVASVLYFRSIYVYIHGIILRLSEVELLEQVLGGWKWLYCNTELKAWHGIMSLSAETGERAYRRCL